MNNHDVSNCFKLMNMINKVIKQKQKFPEDYKETFK